MKTILIRPIITEKTTLMVEKPGVRKKQYAFRVHVDATKPEILKELGAKYNVTIESIRTVLVAGKKRSRYTKSTIIKGRSSNYKKAYITVAEGQEINFFENVN